MVRAKDFSSVDKQRAACGPTIRGPFARKRVCVPPPQEEEFASVKQEFKSEVDINTIMAKAKRGISPPAWLTSSTPRYGDFTGLPQSLTEAYNVVARAEEAFESLPLEFRRAIDHDPRRLDSAPRELFAKFGLLREGAPGAVSGTPEPSTRGTPATPPVASPSEPAKGS